MLAKVAVSTIPAEEEEDQEPTAPGHVCLPWRTHGSGWAGDTEKGIERSLRSNCETQEGPWQPQVPTPLPLPPTELRFLPSHWVPYCLSSRFRLFTYFGLAAPVNSSSLWPNNSSRRQMGKISVIWKTIQLSRDRFSRAPGGCQVLYFVQLQSASCSIPGCFNRPSKPSLEEYSIPPQNYDFNITDVCNCISNRTQ